MRGKAEEGDVLIVRTVVVAAGVFAVGMTFLGRWGELAPLLTLPRSGCLSAGCRGLERLNASCGRGFQGVARLSEQRHDAAKNGRLWMTV